jgi:hypothetical protein
MVSKKCCPVCWELLEEMRGAESNLRVQGFHPILYAVELPGWLPTNIVENMVKRFEEHLRQALALTVELEGMRTAQRQVMEKRGQHV